MSQNYKVKYKDTCFRGNGIGNGIFEVFTHDKRKAVDFGFSDRGDGTYSKRLHHKDTQGISLISEYVKYGELYFAVRDRRSDEVLISTEDSYFGDSLIEESEYKWE